MMNLKHHKCAWLLTALIALLFTACDIVDPGASPTPSPVTTGSITGKAKFDGVAASGINICVEKVEGLTTTSVAAKAQSRSTLASKALTNHTLTDTDGSYTISDLEAGDYTVYAIYTVYGTTTVKTDSVRATVTADDSVTVEDLNLTAAGTISGRVTYDGVAVSGATVAVAGESWSAITDTAGAFTISGVPTGTAYSMIVLYNGSTTLLEDPCTVAANADTDLGTIVLTSPDPELETINIVMKKIPSGYAYARLTVQGSYKSEVDANNAKWNGVDSNTAEVSDGVANLTYKTSSDTLRELHDGNYANAVLLLFSAEDQTVPKAYYSWDLKDWMFLSDNEWTVNTATTGGKYFLKVTGLGLSGFDGDGIFGVSGSNSVFVYATTVQGEDKKRLIMVGCPESVYESVLATSQELDAGISLNLTVFNEPGYFAEPYVFSDIGDLLKSDGSLATLDLADAAPPSLYIDVTLTDYEWVRGISVESVTVTPGNGTEAATIISYRGYAPYIGFAVDRTDWLELVNNGYSIRMVFANGAVFSWTVPYSSTMSNMAAPLLSCDDATERVEPTSATTATTLLITSSGNYTVDLGSIVSSFLDSTGINISPNNVVIEYSMASSGDWNFNCNCYISAGPLARLDYNLGATNDADGYATWWGKVLATYLIVGGYGTTYSTIDGGAYQTCSQGGNLNQYSGKVTLPLSGYTADNDVLTFTSVIGTQNADPDATITIKVSVKE